MKILVGIILLAYVGMPAYCQQIEGLPQDGNGLLDYCNVVIVVLDSAGSIASQNGDRLTEQMRQFGWCTGYLQATQDDLSLTEINLAVTAMTGVTLSGPDKAKQYALDSLRVACIPHEVSVAQSGRVLVKWLRGHPERLHEPRSILVAAALKEAFPCQRTANEKPTASKP